MTDLLCLDANVYVKLLVQEDPPALTTAARRLFDRARRGIAVLAAPGFAWAEVGSTLRKKVRIGEITEARAGEYWDRFCRYPINYLDTTSLLARSWELADQYNLPTLYDAAYLACTELAEVEDLGQREFWTADDHLLSQLGDPLPAYVRQLQ